MNEDLIRQLKCCTTLPTPPSTAVRIIELANSPNASLMQIADAVAFDPALAAKMLKVANSPLYNARRSAGNVRQAISLMGTHAAITIALSFSLVGGLKSAQHNAKTNVFWKRSILSALACRVLAQHFRLPADDLLLAGLLQDIGIIALQTALSERYDELAANAVDHDTLLQIERELLGSGHDEVGYWLLKRWHLPDQLAVSCLTSHIQPASEPVPDANSCVAVSGYLADVFLKPDDPVATLKATNAGARWLGLDAQALTDIIEAMRHGLKEIEDLFDIPLIDAAHAEALVAEAKELIFVANLRQMREIEERSQRDALTGAYNRTYFDDALIREFELATRHGWPLSVAVIDVDHFKQINDTYGHAVGDATLQSLTRVIQSQIRNGDVFARYGGEEFTLLFPGTPGEAAAKVLSRIRETIAAFHHTVDAETAFKVTISIGLACHLNTSTSFQRAQNLINAADQALYIAKSSGRNKLEEATIHF
ncbi:GGDEF domain-containing protein [Noviherbaspirillum saxi]|nr:GGDEF domain-containing protein [Noviherbaspirillum saxi]